MTTPTALDKAKAEVARLEALEQPATKGELEKLKYLLATLRASVNGLIEGLDAQPKEVHYGRDGEFSYTIWQSKLIEQLRAELDAVTAATGQNAPAQTSKTMTMEDGKEAIIDTTNFGDSAKPNGGA